MLKAHQARWLRSIAATVVMGAAVTFAVGLSLTDTQPHEIRAPSSPAPSQAARLAPLFCVADCGSLQFNESGLPSGTGWWVRLEGPSGPAGNWSNNLGTAVSISEPAGTYSYSVMSSGYTATPSTGNVSVVANSEAYVPVSFRVTWAGPYTIVFTQQGLPTNTPWRILLDSTLERSNTTTLSFANLTPNTYTFAVLPVGAYLIYPASGNATIGVTNVTISLSFSLLPSLNSPTPLWEWVFLAATFALWIAWVAYLSVRMFLGAQESVGPDGAIRARSAPGSLVLVGHFVLTGAWTLVYWGVVLFHPYGDGPGIFGLVILIILGMSMANAVGRGNEIPGAGQ